MANYPLINLDADIESAGWTKQTWDLPPYKSPEFFALFTDIDNFRTLPVYKYAVKKGFIVNDEWVGSKKRIRQNLTPKALRHR